MNLRFILILIVFGNLNLIFSAPMETGFLNRTVTVGATTYRYQVYVPFEYSSHKKWPVILCLHGAGEVGDNGLSHTQGGVGLAIRRNPERFSGLAVFPQCPSLVREEDWATTAWIGNMEKEAIKALDQTVKEFNGDPKRLYLTGASMGGFGSWYLAARNPGKFAAVVPLCGGVVVPWLDLEKIPREAAAIMTAADPYKKTAQLLGKTPVWAFHGAIDSCIPVEEGRKAVEALKAAGGNIKYTEYEDQDHDILELTYTNAELISWIFSQHLD